MSKDSPSPDSSAPESPATHLDPPSDHTSGTDQLQVIGASRLSLHGDVHKLVTFLNQTMKDKGYIFGMTKDADELMIKIYQTSPPHEN